MAAALGGRTPPFNRLLRTALQEGGYTFFVRVANVARTAADTKTQHFQLKFTLSPRPTCTFRAQITSRGKTKTVEGGAGLFVDQLSLHSDEWSLTVDISELKLGADPSKFTAGDAHMGYRVELDIDKNVDPGNVQEWQDNKLTMQDALNSGLGWPNRRAMLRIAGQFDAIHINPDGSVTEVHGSFDAGDQAYLCEGGLEAQRKAYQEYQKQGPEYSDDLDLSDPEAMKRKILENFKQYVE